MPGSSKALIEDQSTSSFSTKLKYRNIIRILISYKKGIAEPHEVRGGAHKGWEDRREMK